ncbi:hypothetical protein CA223_05340 [Sphingomonas koreensis]|uniref:Uncharacterized protein n=1 Tax=Sphingomonas koreensis TaxID=93064 RepID=A0A1L6JCX1_9SPHN|nr:hypothetical protein [Sphingomonas koreensis]APR53340.1 hypothetical protein BRX40_13695 [Sphingomonas koreensis]MDC7809968.1 hypothetical protein [Sphingomonas koreensis]RSU24540.1 hypothetical protein CA224_02140 [Sphingomonas koreensis]RSU25185.1 hypothetical protein CA222_13735 [Sphingomonas koreensis]RSU30140.1 hypothetical protein CA225_05615 [Sphingomonas koreensis]
MSLRHQSGRAAGATRAAHAAEIILGLAVGLGLMDRPKEALIAFAIAVLLISIALRWALKQEEKR